MSWQRWPARTRRWPPSSLPSSPRSSAASPSWRRRGYSAASTTPATRWSPSTPAPAAPTRRTGRRSSCACACAGPSGAASEVGDQGGLPRRGGGPQESTAFIARGENAYGLFAAERGVHRLVRISPFDSSARRLPQALPRSTSGALSSMRGSRSRSTMLTCASTPTAPPARAVSTSTRPTRRCGSPTSPAAS